MTKGRPDNPRMGKPDVLQEKGNKMREQGGPNNKDTVRPCNTAQLAFRNICGVPQLQEI